jgi:regulatory protein
MAGRFRSASSGADQFEADPFAGGRGPSPLGDPGDDRFASDGPGGAVPSAPEVDPVERARGLAWRSLNKRDRTINEVGGMLLGKRVEPAVADQVVTELIELGYLNDARYAERFAEDRRRLDAWGSDRIARRLRELGVDQESIEAAVGAQDPEEELDAARELLRRRCPTPPTNRAERDRALGILIRRGYAPELAFDALRRHCGVEPDPDF